jgi:hypothetical protein
VSHTALTFDDEIRDANVPINGQPDMPGYRTVTDALMYADSAT